MIALLCLLIGCLTAASVWLMLSRNLVKFLFGLVLVSNVANLVIIVGGGFEPLSPALLSSASGADTSAAVAPLSNALPQALVLTAIVIGFGLVAFLLVIAVGTYRTFATVDVDAIRFAEPIEPLHDEVPAAVATAQPARGAADEPRAMPTELGR